MRSDEIEFVTIYGSRNPIYRWLTSRFLDTVNDLISQLLVGNEQILDVGCGEGFVIRHLQQQHKDLRIVALDLDTRRIELTKRLSPDLKTIEGNIYNLPFSSELFDIVLANEILEHLDSPERALEQIGRVARRYVICSVPNEPFFSIGNMLRGSHWSRLGKTPAHVNFWSRRAFVKLLSQYFEVQKVKPCFPWVFVLCEIHSTR